MMTPPGEAPAACVPPVMITLLVGNGGAINAVLEVLTPPMADGPSWPPGGRARNATPEELPPVTITLGVPAKGDCPDKFPPIGPG